MTYGELEARILHGERAQAGAPPDVSLELRLTAQAEADAWQQAADADIKHDPAGSAGATTLARHMAAQREQLEAANARYETWAASTSGRREAAGKATAELERRGLAQQAAEHRQAEAANQPRTMLEWWRQLEADLDAVDRAIEREHQAAATAGTPWPPARTLQPGPERVPEPETSPRPGPHYQAARLDEILAQATEAAQRLAADSTGRRPEPSTPLASNEKPQQSPSTCRRPTPPTRQTSSGNSGRTGVAAITARAS